MIRLPFVVAAVALLLTSACGSTSQAEGGTAPMAGRLAASEQAETGPVGTPPPATGLPETSPPAAGRPVVTPEPTSREVALPTGIDPARLEIPAIGVDADIIDLDVRGPEPEVPADFGQTGWYRQTRRPGEIGPSVIAGHIDSVAGPAVFARLDELEVGDEIAVAGADGQRRTFVVTGAGQYPKEALPDEVFGFDQPVPELRLITCGGTFDPSSGHYRDNYVVYGELTGAGSDWGS